MKNQEGLTSIEIYDLNTNQLLTKWNDFVNAINLCSSVRPVTLKAWKRCRQLNFDPYNIKIVYLSKEELNQKQIKNVELIEAADPYMDNLSLSLIDKPYVIALSDSEGWIISLRGTQDILKDEAYGAKIGVNWAERYIGNNAIGTALIEKKSVLIYGGEHFSRIFHSFVSLGIPILKEGIIVGAFGVLVPKECVSPANLTFAIACVNSIESHLTAFSIIKSKLEQIDRLMSIAGLQANIVHDLRNPISVIRGLGQLGSMFSESEKEQKYFKRIIKQVDQLSVMVDDLLNINKEVTTLVLLDQVLLEIVNDNQLFSEVYGIEFETDIQCNKKVNINVKMFKRAINNLIKNSVQAMPEGGKFELKAYTKNNKALITISDTGSGIPTDIKDNIFEPFITTRKNGQGLGLYMVYHTITNLHKGRIWFDSQPGQGTTFFIEIPIIND